MPRASGERGGASDEYRVHDKVLCAWTNGTVHLAEIIDERASRSAGAGAGAGASAGGGAGSSSAKEFYVHYSDCS